MEASETIDRIYEAGMIAETWPDVLQRLSHEYDSVGGVLFAFGADGAQNWVASPDMRPHVADFIRDGWGPLNQRPVRLAALNYEGFACDFDAFTPEELDQDRVYTEFLAPRGLGWTAATMVRVPSGDVLAFSLDRAFKRGPFEDHELLALDDLRPHLARAALLSSRLDLQRAQAMTAALQVVGLPAAVLRDGGGLYAANALFERLMPAAVRDARSRVMLCNGGADNLLADALVRLAVPGTPGQSRSIPLARSEEHPAMIFHVLPVRGEARDIFARSIALLVVTAVDRAAVPTAEVLQGLFDLTPAEARVARGIAEGKTVDTLALEGSVSRETVRTQLAAVLRKTGLNRQAELVALLGNTSIGQRP